MKALLAMIIRAYQCCISPFLGPRCRFYPSCSQYAVECLDLYSVPLALQKISRRLVCCHPLHPGGVDLP